MNKLFMSMMGTPQNQDDGQGELYEVRSCLGVNEKVDDRKNRVKSLLSTWYREYEQYGYGVDAPTFSLEIHALNDEPQDNTPSDDDPLGDNGKMENPMDGYGTYVFIPERMRTSTVSVINNIFSSPIDVPDGFDVLKLLANNYQDEQSQNDPPVATRGLSLAEPDYEPLATWDNSMSGDAMNELFALFDRLGEGQFAGISLLMKMESPDWKGEGNKRIREIEDPTYIAHPTMFQRLKGIMSDNPTSTQQLGGKVSRTAGYDKQSIDANEKAEIDAIKSKQDQNIFRCSCYVYASTDDIADGICDIVRQRTSGRWNRLKISSQRCRLDNCAMRRESQKQSFVLSADEIASIWHVPDDNNSTIVKLHKPLPQISTPPDSVVIVPNGDEGDIKSKLRNYVIGQIRPTTPQL